MKRYWVVSLILFAFAGLAMQCSQAPSPVADSASAPRAEFLRRHVESNAKMAQAAMLTDAMPAPAAEAGGASAPPGPAPMSAMPTTGADRYLIKNANAVIEVADAREASAKLASAVQAVGGYLGDSREEVDGLGHRSVIMQFRVPANRFDESMGQLDPLGKVMSKQITTQDVTEEFVDTDARTRNLKATEARLVDHLNRAGKLEDILRVEQEVSRVRGEIERLEGRLRFLSNRVDYSTISVTLMEAPKAEPVMPARTFSTVREATEALRSLVSFGQALWLRVIWWGIWSVVWGPCLLIVWLLYRRLQKNFKKTS